MSDRPGVMQSVRRAAVSAVFNPTHSSIHTQIEESGWVRDNYASYCPSCGQSVGKNQLPVFDRMTSNPPRCQRCVDVSSPISRVVRLSAYRSPVSDWVHAIKFHADRSIAAELGRQLAASLGEALDESERTVLVPVPTPYRRRVVRGIDHTQAIAGHVSRALSVQLCRALRARQHSPQRTMSMNERPGNTRGVYKLVRKEALASAHVVLVDDVKTSGATLFQAAKAIVAEHRAPVGRISAAVIAVTPAPSEFTPKAPRLST